MTSREFHWNIAGHDITVRIEESHGHGIFHVDGRSLSFRMIQPHLVEIDGKRHRFYVARAGNEYTIWFDGHTYQISRAHKADVGQTASVAASGEVAALMPGKILRIDVESGDSVEEKQTVVLMESMKMESALRAPRSGRVAQICCQVGQIVEMGQVLMIID